MEIKVRVDIAQKPEIIWSVLMDFERWAEWTRSITSIQRLDPAALGIGSQLRIRQPKLKALVWHIFAWEARSLGLLVHARHEIQSIGSGSIVILTIHQTG